jgi:hypothetical protein
LSVPRVGSPIRDERAAEPTHPGNGSSEGAES